MQVGLRNMEADEKSAYYNVQVGWAQHGEFRKEILQTMQVGLVQHGS